MESNNCIVFFLFPPFPSYLSPSFPSFLVLGLSEGRSALSGLLAYIDAAHCQKIRGPGPLPFFSWCYFPFHQTVHPLCFLCCSIVCLYLMFYI